MSNAPIVFQMPDGARVQEPHDVSWDSADGNLDIVERRDFAMIHPRFADASADHVSFTDSDAVELAPTPTRHTGISNAHRVTSAELPLVIPPAIPGTFPAGIGALRVRDSPDRYQTELIRPLPPTVGCSAPLF